MGVKNIPLSLYNLALQTVSTCMLQQWTNTYYTTGCTTLFAEQLKNSVGVLIPCSIHNEIFDLMIESHVISLHAPIQDGKDTEHQSVVHLINSIISPNLRKLSLSCLRDIGGWVTAHDITHLENMLLKELPALTNLVEICLQASSVECTLPSCNDEILDKIGNYCPNLKRLDVSYNPKVTNSGLQCLIPSETRRGCPLLVKLFLFDCSVSQEGIISVLKGLYRLKFLGFRETGQSILSLAEQDCSFPITKLKLAHINNLGENSPNRREISRLSCSEVLVNAICSYCPKLNALKVRVSDSSVLLLQKINTATILELVYNLGTPSSPGNGTIQYLNLCGTQFVTLSFDCDTFTVKYLKVVCEQCTNLKKLVIKSTNFRCDQDISNSDMKKCSLFSLEVFFFRVGWYGVDDCRISHNVLSYILHKSSVLREMVLAMNNLLFTDLFIEQLFSSIQTSNLKEVMIVVPHKYITASSINLTMTSVKALINVCPQLQKLGDLFVWVVSRAEIKALKRQLRRANSALVLT